MRVVVVCGWAHYRLVGDAHHNNASLRGTGGGKHSVKWRAHSRSPTLQAVRGYAMVPTNQEVAEKVI